ncbi:MAG: type II toxin-antitoxin system RelB/DinJ family antitoxin [Kiritimatiellaeota bacterium]|nr:type II toxin-antitoxin system RelB/DinJ family antitoxin [Kiritimatiellota bacterium]
MNVRIDKTLKEDVVSILGEIGLTPNDAVRVLFKKIARERAVPFALSDVDAYNDKTIRALKRARDAGNLIPVGTSDDLRSYLAED